VSRSLASNVSDMLTGAKDFSEGMRDVWRTIKSIALSILDEILQHFIHSFLKGILDGIAGSGIGQALGRQFAGLFGFGGGGGLVGSGVSLAGGLLGGGGVPSITAYGAGAGYGGGAAAGVTAGSIAGGAIAGGLFVEALAPGFFKQAFTDFWGTNSPENQAAGAMQGIIEAAAYLGMTPEEYAASRGIEMPMFKDGGVATGPTPGIFGEAGPEALIPLDRLPDMMGGGPSVSIHIDARGAYLQDDESLRRLASEIVHFLPSGVLKWGFA
jgi:hypothetical protein